MTKFFYLIIEKIYSYLKYDLFRFLLALNVIVVLFENHCREKHEVYKNYMAECSTSQNIRSGKEEKENMTTKIFENCFTN